MSTRSQVIYNKVAEYIMTAFKQTNKHLTNCIFIQNCKYKTM